MSTSLQGRQVVGQQPPQKVVFARPAHMRGGRGVGAGGCWCEWGGKRFYARSKMEARYGAYLQWLRERGQILDYDHEPVEFEFPIKRGTRFYKPDYRVTELNGRVVFHETKGFLDAKSKTQLNRMRIHHPEVQILVVSKADVARIRRQVGALIPGWA